MPDNKTKPETASVDAFIESVADPVQRDDAKRLCTMMSAITGEPPVMWGSSMIGFGRYHYRYESGREGDAMRIGFAPRIAQTVIYVMDGFPGHDALLAALGPHKRGKSCLYIKRLSGVDASVLDALMTASVAHMAVRYPD